MLNARTALSPRTPIVIHLHVHPKREHVVKPYAASSKRSYKCGKSICVVKKNKKKQLSTSFNHLKECLDSCEVALWISLHQPQGNPQIWLCGPHFHRCQSGGQHPNRDKAWLKQHKSLQENGPPCSTVPSEFWGPIGQSAEMTEISS